MKTGSFTIILLALLTHVYGYSFSFQNKPTQCNRLTVNIDGTGGRAPYRLVLVPSGPLPNGPEIRTIIDQEFSDTTFSLDPLAFPGGSNFTAIMSDASGAGTGGTSVITDVAQSNDNSCLATSPTNPLFYIILPDNNSPVQCGSMRFTFDNPQGQVNLWALIPGGESFAIDVPAGSNSVTWSPIRIPAGTGVMLVAGDSRGRGTGGSTGIYIVGGGSSDCLSGAEVYSSTPAPYAGGQYATGSGGGTVVGPWNHPNGSTSTSTTKSKTGMIAGIVVGVVALVALCLLLGWLYLRKREKKQKQRRGTKEIDLLTTDRPAPVENGMEPTPYMTPPSSNAAAGMRPASAATTTDAPGRRSSANSHDPIWRQSYRPVSPSTNTSYSAAEEQQHASANHGHHALGQGGFGVLGTQAMNKHAEAPSRLRPVNVIQHEDGGAVTSPPPPAVSPEIVELPPSYAEVRRAEDRQA